MLDFQDLMNSSMTKVVESREEARFSFIQGGYVEDIDSQGIQLFHYRAF